MVKEAVDRWGRLDILIQNAFSVTAGDTRIKGSAEKVSEEDWDWGMAVLAKALYLGAKYAVPHMRKAGGGSIINIGSIHSYFAESGMLAYEAGKAAAVAITKQLAVEYGPDNIRVNAIGPGHIVSEGFVEMWKKNPDGLKFFAEQYPVRRTGTPDDVAGPILFLCSDDASFITGHTLMVDGGLTVQLQEQFGLRQARYALDNPKINLPD
jgi:NAD(P)-dependent dehydrogenase (short-subunit alcohol dehydrogenase family)